MNVLVSSLLILDAKCEFMNPGGSIKDRIALAMLQDAQKNGVVNANTVLVEPTSGNTGIGIAFNCAISGIYIENLLFE